MIELTVRPKSLLSRTEYNEILDLCAHAYGEDLSLYLAEFEDAVHVMGRAAGTLVTHGLWVTRWLKIEDGPLLRTAYVEAVATAESHRRHGYAAQVMQRIVAELEDFDIAGLAPFSEEYYGRLGWETWCGPLLIRKDDEIFPTPPDEDGDEECLMIYRLPRTPHLDLNSPISVEWRKYEVW